MVSAQRTILTYWFRVDTYDKSGRRVSYPVEMKAERFSGILNEGDLVQFNARVKEGEILRVSKLRNLTAGGTFRRQGNGLKDYLMIVAGLPGKIIYAVLYVGFFVGFMALLIMVAQAVLSGVD